MAWQTLPTWVDGMVVHDTHLAIINNNLNDLDTDRDALVAAVGLPWTGGTALSRITTLESTVGNGTTGNAALGTRVTNLETNKADKTITLTAGSGLTGGGTLAANRTFAVDFGNGAAQVATGARALALEGRTISAGTGLTGGGDLTANRTLAVNFGDSATQVATGARALALEQGRALNRYARWYSTETATHSSATEAVGSWTAVGTPMSDVTVSGGTFTVVNAGVYEITAGYNGTYNLTVGTGFNVNFFIADTGLTTIYSQVQGYYNQYASGAKELSTSLATGPIALAANSTFGFYVGTAQAVTTANSSTKRTYMAIRRVS